MIFPVYQFGFVGWIPTWRFPKMVAPNHPFWIGIFQIILSAPIHGVKICPSTNPMIVDIFMIFPPFSVTSINIPTDRPYSTDTSIDIPINFHRSFLYSWYSHISRDIPTISHQFSLPIQWFICTEWQLWRLREPSKSNSSPLSAMACSGSCRGGGQGEGWRKRWKKTEVG